MPALQTNMMQFIFITVNKICCFQTETAEMNNLDGETGIGHTVFYRDNTMKSSSQCFYKP